MKKQKSIISGKKNLKINIWKIPVNFHKRVSRRIWKQFTCLGESTGEDNLYSSNRKRNYKNW